MGSQPRYEGIVLDQVVYPTPTAIDKVDSLTYIKQDGQKMDDAKVPTHLWSFFFRDFFPQHFVLENRVAVVWRN